MVSSLLMISAAPTELWITFGVLAVLFVVGVLGVWKGWGL